MKCEDCPNAEWDCVDGHWFIYGCMGECEGPVQPAGHTALYIRQNWHGWQQCDDFKDEAEEES